MPPKPIQSISVPAILLALGSTCLVVAAIVFIAVSWSGLNIGIKALILAAVTAFLAAGAAVAASRNLRATTESLSVAASSMLVVNLVAARGYGLLELDSLHPGSFATIFGLVLAVPGVVAAVAARMTPLGKLVGEQIFAVIGLGVSLLGLAAIWEYNPVILQILAVLALSGIALIAQRFNLSVLKFGAAAQSLLSWVALLSLGLWDAFTHPSASELWLHSEALGLVSAAALSAATTATPRLMRELAVLSATTACGIVLLLIWIPPANASVTSSVLALVGGTILLAALGKLINDAVMRPPVHVGVNEGRPIIATSVQPTSGPASEPATGVRPVRGSGESHSPIALIWRDGAKIAAGIGCLPLALLVIAFLGSAATVALNFADVWQFSPMDELPHRLGDGAIPPWLAAIAAVGVGIVLLIGFPGVPIARSSASWLVAAGVTSAVILSAPLAIALIIGIGFAGAAYGLGRVRDDGQFLTASLLPAVLFGLLAMQSTATHLMTWLVLAVLSVVVVVTARQRAVADVACVLGVVTILGSFYPGAELLHLSIGSGAVGCAAGVIALMTVAQFVVHTRRRPCRPWIEGAAAAMGTLSFFIATPRADQLTIVLLLLAAAAIVASLLSQDRRWLFWVGQVLGLLVTWQRLFIDNVLIVEAYTLPAAAIILAAGFWRRHQHPDTHSYVALSPGLIAATVPSLLLALVDPASTRGALIAVACIALIVWGAALRQAAPLVVGAIEMALLLLGNVTPVAQAAPRWISIAVVGVALLATGITWEQRIADMKSAARYVRQLA
jgi:hypothetical protein